MKECTKCSDLEQDNVNKDQDMVKDQVMVQVQANLSDKEWDSLLDHFQKVDKLKVQAVAEQGKAKEAQDKDRRPEERDTLLRITTKMMTRQEIQQRRPEVREIKIEKEDISCSHLVTGAGDFPT